MTHTGIEPTLAAAEYLAPVLAANSDELPYDDESAGLFADVLRPRIDGYNVFITRIPELAQRRLDITRKLQEATLRFGEAPTPQELKELAEKADLAAAKGDAGLSRAIRDEFIQKSREREAELKIHTAAVEEAREALREWQAEWALMMEEMAARGLTPPTPIAIIDKDAVGDPSNPDWRRKQEDEESGAEQEDATPRRSPINTSPSTDAPPKIYPSTDAKLDEAPGGTELSSSSATPTTSGVPYIPMQGQPASSSAMPSFAQTPAFSPSPSVNPSSKDRDKSKERKPAEETLGALPVATPVPVELPLDRGTSTTGTTTKDVSGKGNTIGLTNAPPGANANPSNPRAGGGGVYGGAPMGGAPIGSGGKSTTADKRPIWDADRNLTRREDNDISIKSGTVTRDSLEAPEREEAAEEDRIARKNTEASDKRKG